MLKGKKIFISGGAGVIGKELVKKLHKEGAIIFVGDLQPRPLEWPPEILYRQGDLNYITKEEIDHFSPDFFFHLAATFERSTESYEFWDENFYHNLRLSHYLMTLLKDAQHLKKVIFASSYLIYDQSLYSFITPQEKPYALKESDPINPRNLTGMAKLNHEIELKFIDEFKSNKLQVILARIYRSYGKGSRDVISRWVRALLKGETLHVYHKENIFDYIYAGDVAEGLLRLSKTNYSGVVNLGSGKSRKISDILVVLKKYFPNLRYKEICPKSSYEASQADMALYKKITNWLPNHTLENTIPKIIEFEKKNKVDKFEPLNVLITCISNKVPLIKAVRIAMKKISGDGKLYGGDLDGSCTGRYFVDKFYQMPGIQNVNFNQILKYCTDNKISAIIPTRDGELMFWARHKDEFLKQRIDIMVSSLSGTDITLDKLKFYQKGIAWGYPVIKTVINIEDLTCQKYVVKERFGAGSTNIALNVEKNTAHIHSHTLKDPIFQPYIEGKEFSVDLYVAKDKKTKGAIVRKRDVVVNGESQTTTLLENPKMAKMCSSFAERLKLYGHVIFQVIVDRKNQIHIVECNSRFGGASTLSIACGLDSFYWYFLESKGINLINYPFLRLEKKLKLVRIAEDIFLS